jgi:hypothetical protein
VVELVRLSFLWAFASSFTSAAVSGIGRTFCLPPYWPPQYVLRCRPGRMAEALMHLPLDVALTTLFLFVPALLPAAVIALLFVFSAANRWLRAAFAFAGAVMWFVLVKRLEPGHLDFIVGGYAIALGAAAGVLVVRQVRTSDEDLYSAHKN